MLWVRLGGKKKKKMCKPRPARRGAHKFMAFVKWQNQEGTWEALPGAARWPFTFLPRCDAEEVFLTINKTLLNTFTWTSVLAHFKRMQLKTINQFLPVDLHLWAARYVLPWTLPNPLATSRPSPLPHPLPPCSLVQILLRVPPGLWYSFLSATFFLSQQVFPSLNLQRERAGIWRLCPKGPLNY